MLVEEMLKSESPYRDFDVAVTGFLEPNGDYILPCMQ